jgi:hypothetical protein
MSLPAAWVDRIFDKLSITYGRDFTGRYEGMDINAVKSDWAHELSGFFQHPSAISFVLSNLPDRAPSVIDFRKIARLSPVPGTPRIEHSPAGKERIAAELARVAPALQAKAPVDSRDWARRIMARHEGGDKRLTRAQLDMARSALRVTA